MFLILFPIIITIINTIITVVIIATSTTTTHVIRDACVYQHSTHSFLVTNSEAYLSSEEILIKMLWAEIVPLVKPLG